MVWMDSENSKLIIAGLFGSAVAVSLDWTGVIPSTRRFLTGGIIAYFAHDLAVPITNMFLGSFGNSIENSVALSGFLMGVVGVVFIETLLLAGKKFKRKFIDG